MDLSGSESQARIEAARRLLEAELDTDLSLEDVAREAQLSPFHFHRVFRAMTGETVRGFTRRLRLERAAHRLTQGEGDLLSVALAAGYGSHEAFTRAFAKHFGTPPSEYRGRRRERFDAPEPGAQELGAPGPDPLVVEIREEPSRTVAFVRHIGSYSEVGDAWGTLMKWGWRKMIFRPPATFGLCYDDPDVTPSEKLRYEACMEVSSGTRVKPPVELQVLPAATYAVAVHHGPFEDVGATYAQLFARILHDDLGGRRWRLGDPPAIEAYLTDPRKTKPADLRTELWMPVLPG